MLVKAGSHCPFLRIEQIGFFYLLSKFTDSSVGRASLMCTQGLMFGTEQKRILKSGQCELTFGLTRLNLIVSCGGK